MALGELLQALLTEWFRLEGTSKIIKLQSSIANHPTRLPRPLSIHPDRGFCSDGMDSLGLPRKQLSFCFFFFFFH